MLDGRLVVEHADGTWSPRRRFTTHGGYPLQCNGSVPYPGQYGRAALQGGTMFYPVNRLVRIAAIFRRLGFVANTWRACTAADHDGSGPSASAGCVDGDVKHRNRMRARVALGTLTTVLSALLLVPSAGASQVASVPLVTCAGTASGSTPPCPAHSITKAEKKIIALDEAPGGKPIVKPYEDAEGFCTIGLGHLIHKGSCSAQDFADWKGATVQSLLNLFNQDIASREAQLNAILVSRLGLKLDPCQYDALFDLYFNGGASWIGPKSRIYSVLKNKDISAVPAIIASDVPPHLSQQDKAVITARRQQEANRFRTRHCPCKFIEIYGTVQWHEQFSYGSGWFGGITRAGTFKIDLISVTQPHPNYWDTAGSTYQISDKTDYGTVGQSCNQTETGSMNASGTLPYGESIGETNGIAASWAWAYSPPWVGFTIVASGIEKLTTTYSGATCSSSSTRDLRITFAPQCPGSFGGRLNEHNNTIPINCSGKDPSAGRTYTLRGTLNVYPS